jgi:hypothetical protein
MMTGSWVTECVFEVPSDFQTADIGRWLSGEQINFTCLIKGLLWKAAPESRDPRAMKNSISVIFSVVI